jgi:hypothetical protein
MVWFVVFYSCNHIPFLFPSLQTYAYTLSVPFDMHGLCYSMPPFSWFILSKERSVDLKKKHGFIFIFVVFWFFNNLIIF